MEHKTGLDKQSCSSTWHLASLFEFLSSEEGVGEVKRTQVGRLWRSIYPYDVQFTAKSTRKNPRERFCALIKIRSIVNYSTTNFCWAP